MVGANTQQESKSGRVTAVIGFCFALRLAHPKVEA